jgi:(2Fe-2S) ferredoxin
MPDNQKDTNNSFARSSNFLINKNQKRQKREIKMPKQIESPYVSHVFVCTNDRGGERKSCADNNSQLIKTKLKDAVNEKGWKGKVRISTSGCMGLCANGPNVMIYPQQIWFSEVFPDDVDEIVSAIERIMPDD